MRQREPRGHEISVPLTHPPGPAQADFGEAVVVIGGVEQTAQFFFMDLLRHGFAAQRCLLCRAYSKAAMASVLRNDMGQGAQKGIPGFVPSVAVCPAGCRFHPRSLCKTEVGETSAPPLLLAVDKDSALACHNPPEGPRP